MAFAERIPLIKQIETERRSRVICYLTSLRPNVPSQIADDQVRVFFDHLLSLPEKPVDKLDVFLCSNGGSGTVPWRMVALFREFAKSFSVLIPYRAYSAASLLALGADEIVMHPFAELGPIDPTVSNDFNPIEQATGRRLGISVEDVRAYVSFIKDTVGITHEDELVKVIQILAEKIHPLALGNVERFVMQSRMIAKKILNLSRKPALFCIAPSLKRLQTVWSKSSAPEVFGSLRTRSWPDAVTFKSSLGLLLGGPSQDL